MKLIIHQNLWFFKWTHVYINKIVSNILLWHVKMSFQIHIKSCPLLMGLNEKHLYSTSVINKLLQCFSMTYTYHCMVNPHKTYTEACCTKFKIRYPKTLSLKINYLNDLAESRHCLLFQIYFMCRWKDFDPKSQCGTLGLIWNNAKYHNEHHINSTVQWHDLFFYHHCDYLILMILNDR